VTFTQLAFNHLTSTRQNLHLRNDLYCVNWAVKLYSFSTTESRQESSALLAMHQTDTQKIAQEHTYLNWDHEETDVAKRVFRAGWSSGRRMLQICTHAHIVSRKKNSTLTTFQGLGKAGSADLPKIRSWG